MRRMNLEARKQQLEGRGIWWGGEGRPTSMLHRSKDARRGKEAVPADDPGLTSTKKSMNDAFSG